MSLSIEPAMLAFAGVGISVVVWAFTDYRAWRALGPGGLPATWLGWLTTTRLRMLKRNPLKLRNFGLMQNGSESSVTYTDLPTRAGPRPKVAPHPVPHRQLTDHAPAIVRDVLAERFSARAGAEPERLNMRRSHFEKHTMAVTVHPDYCCHPVARNACGEAGHVHPSDGSMHMILSPNDTCAVIERGWGELHGLAGRAYGLPSAYTLIYAPRTEVEVDYVMCILDRAITYMTSDPAMPVRI